MPAQLAPDPCWFGGCVGRLPIGRLVSWRRWHFAGAEQARAGCALPPPCRWAKDILLSCLCFLCYQGVDDSRAQDVKKLYRQTVPHSEASEALHRAQMEAPLPMPMTQRSIIKQHVGSMWHHSMAAMAAVVHGASDVVHSASEVVQFGRQQHELPQEASRSQLAKDSELDPPTGILDVVGGGAALNTIEEDAEEEQSVPCSRPLSRAGFSDTWSQSVMPSRLGSGSPPLLSRPASGGSLRAGPTGLSSRATPATSGWPQPKPDNRQPARGRTP